MIRVSALCARTIIQRDGDATDTSLISRRTKCSERLVEGKYPQVSSSEFERLDDFHRAAVTIAQPEGHSQPIASGSARTAIGKAIGHVT